MTIFYILIAAVISSIVITAVKIHSEHKKELSAMMDLFDHKSIKE